MEFLSLLIVATLFGGMTLYSFGFAPLAFRALGPEPAGRLLREAFRWYYLFVAIFGAGGAALMATLDAASAGLLAATAAAALFARQGLMPRINAARDAQLAGEPPAKGRFARLHGASVAINFAQLGALAWVLHRFL